MSKDFGGFLVDEGGPHYTTATELRMDGPDNPFKAMLDSLPMPAWSCEPTGSTEFLNAAWLEFGGFRETRTPTLEWQALIHDGDRTTVEKSWAKALAACSVCYLKARLRDSQGGFRWFAMEIAPVRDPSGRLQRWFGLACDIDDSEGVQRELGLIFNSTPALLHTTLPDGRLDFVNQGWIDFLGLPLDQITGWQWTAAFHPDDVEACLDKWRTALAAGVGFEAEGRVRRADGTYRTLLHRKVPLRNAHGNIVKWCGSSIDIEDRKRMEDSLLQSEAQFATALDTIPGLVWSAKPNGDIDYLNQRWREYTGLSLDEAGGWGWQAAIHPDDVEALVSYWKSVLSSAKHGETEARLRRFDGAYRWFLFRAVPLYDSSGEVVKWYGQTTDIHERREAEDRLRQQEAELRQMLNFTPQMVAVLSPEGRTLFMNEVGLEYLGITLEEVRQDAIRSRIHPDDVERLRSERERALAGNTYFENEQRALGKDGKYRWFFIRYNPLRDARGKVVRWYAAGTNIDDRKQAELRLQNENVALREEIDSASMFEEIVGTSQAVRGVLASVSKVAPTDSTVLIVGETGTGKELIARRIHRTSNRGSRAFVSVNCAAVPRDLIASELFGHEKGAFTGASQRRLGRFELAETGTIFLDEVGELSPEMQVALLRVLQEHEFERVGGERSIKADVRVIAATNRDLAAAIAAGSFRSDLFYRLNVFPIEVPPLRERPEDIPVLVEYFVNRYARKIGKHIRGVSQKTMELLTSYPWPGNIRELQNVIERSVILAESETLAVDERWLSTRSGDAETIPHLARELDIKEKEMIESALRFCGGRIAGPRGAAARLGIARSTLESKIRALGINKHQLRVDSLAREK